MKKIEKLDYKELNYNILSETDYDDLFESKIRLRGKYYYQNNQIESLKQTDSGCKAVVKGTKDYNVEIKFLKKNKIDVSCECPYHKDTNIYCKHIYAVLLSIHNEPLKKQMLEDYNNNLKRLEEILSNVEKMVKDNDKYFVIIFSRDLAQSRPKEIKENIDKLKNNFDLKNDFALTRAINLSFIYLKEAIEAHNDIIDDIEYGIKAEEDSKNPSTISRTYTIDDSAIFEAADRVMASVPSNKLEGLRTEMIKNGEDTEIIDKAIKNSKAREKKIKQIQNRNNVKSFFRALDTISNIILFPIKIFFAIVTGLNEGSSQSKSSSLEKEMDAYNLEDWQKDLVRKGEYDPWNFEEEDLEEDDYYYEDD